MERTLKMDQDTSAHVQNLLNEAPFSTALLTGPDLIIELANEASLQLWGKDKSILGKKLLDALPEMRSQPYYDILTTVYRTGEPYEGKESIAYLQVGGEMKQIYVNFVFKAMHNSEGEITGVLATGYDVTELVESRQRIADAEARARLAIDAAGLGTFDYKMAGDLLVTSARFDAMFGFAAPKGLGDYLAVIHPDDRKIRDQALDRALKTGDILYEVRLTWADQSVHWVRLNGKVYFDESGHPARLVGTAYDITGQRLSLRKLEESEWRFRTLITEAPEIASGLYIGPEFRIQYVNDVMLKLWNKDSSIIGKTICEAVPELVGQPFPGYLERVYATGETHSGKEEKAMLYRDGKLVPSYYNYTYKALRDADGNIYGIHHMAHDVTDMVVAKENVLNAEKRFREELEVKIKERTRELERSNDELQQFAYVASHDLQEPLRKIEIFTERLHSSLTNVSEKSRDYMERIMVSTRRMVGLIRDVLNFSRVTRAQTDFEPVNLNEALNEVISDYEMMIEEKHAAIHHGDLPVIEGIPSQISQLFNNLLNNSLKFSDPQRTPQIIVNSSLLSPEELLSHVDLNRFASYVKIEWSDNGIGFDQQYASQVFEIFERLNDRLQYSGSGIGLAICKRIVANHRGEIYTTSAEGSGATFHIILPVSQTR